MKINNFNVYILIALLTLAGLSSAMVLYGGESYSFPVNVTDVVYTVVGNSSNLEGLKITLIDGYITITPALNFKPDSFTLVFIEPQTREVVRTIRVGSGGGTRTIYVNQTEIVNRTQTEYIDITQECPDCIEVEIDEIDDEELRDFPVWLIILIGILVVVFFIAIAYYILKSL